MDERNPRTIEDEQIDERTNDEDVVGKSEDEEEFEEVEESDEEDIEE